MSIPSRSSLYARVVWTLPLSLAALANCGPSGRRETGVIEEDATQVPDVAPQDVPSTPDAPPPMDAAPETSSEPSPDVQAPDAVDAPAPDMSAPDMSAPDMALPACSTGLRRCGDRCVDIASDGMNCGSCGTACVGGPRATAACVAGECENTCERGYADCDGMLTTGCESSLATVEHCGSCTRACTAGQLCGDGACVNVEMAAPPRLVAPLSGVRVTRRRPEFVVIPLAGGPGTEVQICRARACDTADVVTTLTATSARLTAPMDLAPGVYFWRARTGAAGRFGTRYSPTWQFRVPARDGTTNGSWGAEPDFNGDGLADVAVGAPLRDNGFGAAYVFYGTRTTPAATPDWRVNGSDGVNTNYGVAVSAVGDVNGDGFVDLGVGAFLAGIGAGRVYVYYGGPAGLATTHAYVVAAGEGMSRMGETLTAVGDANGDGYADFATGAPTFGGVATGAVYVYSGRPTGAPSSAAQVLRAMPEVEQIRVGRGLSTVGDVNGDGYGDLIAGAPGQSGYQSAAYLFTGAPTGFGEAPSQRLRGVGGEAMPRLGDGFGVSVAGVGDVNGDGFFDVLVGAQGAANTQGYMRLYLGSARGLDAMASWEYAGNAAGTLGGRVSGGADVNSDGYDDLGSVEYNRHARVWLGGATGPAGDGIELQSGGGAIGVSGIAFPGDVNGDGFADVLIGAAEADDRRGVVQLYLGAMDGVQTTAAWRATGPDATSRFGASVGRW